MTTTEPQDAESWTNAPSAAGQEVTGALAALPDLWLTGPAIAAAAGMDRATAAAHLAVLAATGAVSTRGARYRLAEAVDPGAVPANLAAVRGVAHWYLLGAKAALTEIGADKTYWTLPATSGPEISAQRFADLDGAHAWLLGEEGNLRAVLAAADAAGLHAHVWRLATLQLQAWTYRGAYDRWQETADLALDAANAAGEPVGQSDALAYQARGYSQRGLLKRADDLQHRALEIRERAGDPIGLARSHNDRGLIAHRHADLDGAIAHYRTCQQIAASCGHDQYEAIARVNLADALRTQGHLDQAAELLEQVTDYCRHHHSPLLAAGAARLVADVLGLQGHTTQALTAAEQALAQSALLPETAGLAWAQHTYARALLRAERPTEAIEALRATAALHGAVHDRQRQTQALDLAADLYDGNGQHAQADTLRARAAQLRNELSELDTEAA